MPSFSKEPNINEILDRIKNINSIKYQLIFLNNEGEVFSRSNVYRKSDGGEKVRIEMMPVAAGKEMILLGDLKEGYGTMYYYVPEDNKARGPLVATPESNIEGTKSIFLEAANIIKNNNSRIIGKENLNGKECLIIETSTEGVKTKHWVWIEYGLPIKTVAPVETLGGEIDTSRHDEVRRDNLEVNIDISDDLFKLPAGVEIITS